MMLKEIINVSIGINQTGFYAGILISHFSFIYYLLDYLLFTDDTTLSKNLQNNPTLISPVVGSIDRAWLIAVWILPADKFTRYVSLCLAQAERISSTDK